jgi:hypothetical protein
MNNGKMGLWDVLVKHPLVFVRLYLDKTARTVAIRRGEKINAPALSTMLKQIIANNRAGGWRKLKSRD